MIEWNDRIKLSFPPIILIITKILSVLAAAVWRKDCTKAEFSLKAFMPMPLSVMGKRKEEEAARKFLRFIQL